MRPPVGVALGQATLPNDSTRIRGSYWLEGGLFFTGAVAVLTAATASGNCESGHHCLATNLALFFLGSMVMFPIGALIGGQIPK